MTDRNEKLRQEQNARRDKSRPVTIEDMIRELAEEAEDTGTDPETAGQLRGLLDLEKKTRGFK